jgi:hypothetical protein
MAAKERCDRREKGLVLNSVLIAEGQPIIMEPFGAALVHKSAGRLSVRIGE